MKDRLQTMLDMEIAFLKDRPIMERNNRDPEQIAQKLHGESVELVEAIGAFCLGQIDIKEVAQEAIDVLKYLFSICLMFNIDIFGEFVEKTAFNIVRFNATDFSDPTKTYDEVYKASKSAVKRDNIKEHFYA